MPADRSTPFDSTVPDRLEAATGSARPRHRPREDVLADAIRVLTEAARLTRPLPDSEAAAATRAAGQPAGGESGREPADWAEFVSYALAGAAANIGGIEAALAGRPGSWEADGVRNLLISTVGYDEEYLLAHRTEALVFVLDIDDVLEDLGAWKPYDDASQELVRRYEAIGIATVTGVPGDPVTDDAVSRLEPATEEQERQAEEIAELEMGLERQRLRDWAAYGRALQAAVEAQAARLPGLTVPVVVRVELETSRWAKEQRGATGGPIDQVISVAIQNTELPGGGRPPLVRLRT
jgi:hypothetical protein